MDILFFMIICVFLLIATYAFRKNRVYITGQSPQIPEVTDKDCRNSNVQDKGSQTIMFALQTHKIKYCIYGKHFLESYDTKRLYDQITLENLWFNEPFYTSFFRILLLLDKNELFMADPYSRIITSNLRDKNNAIVQVKSYQVLSIQQVVCKVLEQVYDDIFKFNQKDAQNIIMAICIYIIKKAKIFESWNQEYILEILLENYEDTTSVEKILLLIDSKHEKLLFVNHSVKSAIKEVYREPYVDKGGGYEIQLSSKLPQKQLLHI